MSRIAITILSIFLVQTFFGKTFAQKRSVANIDTCERYVKAYNIYEELLAGKIVESFSVFDVTDWSEDSAFEGLLLTPETPEKAELRIGGDGNQPVFEVIESFEKWEKDSQYRKASFDPSKYFANASKAKSFGLELHSDGQVLCKETKVILKENE